MASDDIWILGIRMTKFGKHKDKDVLDLATEAVLGALDDGGVTMKDMGVIAAGYLMGGPLPIAQQIQKQVGQTGIPAYNVSNACATGATALRVHFNDFWLPESAELYLFTLDGQVFGPYTSSGPHGDGDFWSHTLLGDRVVLQLRHHGTVTPADLATTMYNQLGIVADKELMAPGDRPIEIVDGGKVLKEIIA